MLRALQPGHVAQESGSVQTEKDQTAVASSPFHSLPLFKSGALGLTDQQKAQMDIDGHLVLPGILTDEAVDRLIASMSKIQTIASTIDQTSDGHRARAGLQKTFQAWTHNHGDASQAAKDAKREEFQEDLAKLRTQYPELQKLGVGQTAMEYDEYLESCVGHPQMLRLARDVLGEDIRFDHMVALNRPGGVAPMGYHTHEYADNKTSFDNDEEFPRVGSLAPDVSPDATVPNDPSLGMIRICKNLHRRRVLPTIAPFG
eukprot:COSAG02_NODE_94_length_37427_cov_79.161728_11_plen_258_part_00